MTAPSSTKEFDEAADAAFDLVKRVMDSLKEESPGGKKITLEEILHTVTDGQVRQSLMDLWNSVQSLLRGGKFDLFDLLAQAGEAVMDFVGVLASAFADGRLTPDEIVNGVTDGHIRDGLLKAIEGAEKIPGELTGLNPLAMVRVFSRVLQRLRELREAVPA